MKTLKILGCFGLSTKKAWVTRLVFENWFRQIFLLELKAYCKEDGL
jgi:hypothetical protein